MSEPATAQPTRPRTARRWVFRALRTVACVYVGLMAILYYLQTSLIFPGAQTQGRPEAIVVPLSGAELVTLQAGGEEIVALFGPALGPDGGPRADAALRPSLIYFYGNGMCLRNTVPIFEQFRRMGLNVIVPEYLGYGMSGGRPSEQGCYASADAAYEYLVGRPDVDPSKVVAVGWSLGGAVAVDLAERRQIARLAIFSSFTSMDDMARRAFPFLPVSLLLRHHFDAVRKISQVRCPIMIGHGSRDSIVPPVMADRLAAASRAPVTRLVIDGADHNDFFAVGDSKIFTALEQFLEPMSRRTED